METQEKIGDHLLEKISIEMQIPVEIIKTCNMEELLRKLFNNSIALNNSTDNSISLDKTIELYERIIQEKDGKIKLLERLLQEKK
ncbi:hypothetical protein AGMMS50262_23690 [Bacteroidia bacterium]|nr:hypothetical protein AGMMS50262_23690 [Bacteroidia bacterium]